MAVSLTAYAYLKFWNTPSIDFWSEITELAFPIDSSKEGAKGFLHPNKIKERITPNNILITQPPF